MIMSIPSKQLSLDLSSEYISTIVAESGDVMSEIVLGISEQFEGGETSVVISEDNKILKLSQIMSFIPDPLHVDINSRAMLKQLYTDLQEIGNEQPDKINEINRLAIDFLDDLSVRSNFNNITYNLELSVESLLKTYEVKLEPLYGSMSDRLSEYVKAVSNLLGVKVFCFVNLKAFLSEQRLNELFTMTRYYNVNLILIEYRDRNEICPEKSYIIDKDQCIIVK